jgi:hypothetical protein
VRKLLVCLVMVMFIFPLTVHAQSTASYYVKADGNDDDNDGLSELWPLQSLSWALCLAQLTSIKKITVIGTLDVRSESATKGAGFILGDFSQGKNTSEIIITGKPNVSSVDRAVLSGLGLGAGVLAIIDIKIRLEHIEISGGEGEQGNGIELGGAATLTLGTGTVVRRNQGIGLVIVDDGSSAILDGGEIRENNKGGVLLGKGSFAMRSGSINSNNDSGIGVVGGGVFTMSGGTISGNSAGDVGGGVYVSSGCTFNQTGGAISNNTAKRGSNPNIFRAVGALGANL